MKMQISGALAAMLLMAAHPASAAMTEADCLQAFDQADTNKDGTLSEAEAARFNVTSKTANKAAPEGNITKDAFLTNCKAGAYTTAANTDPGAPVAGANSFTEGQAKDRISAAGFTDISKLSKDDKGVWRGTATQSGKQVNVAVDYRGNVVAQ